MNGLQGQQGQQGVQGEQGDRGERGSGTLTRGQTIAALVVVFLVVISLNFVQNVKSINNSRESCVRGNAAREFDWVFGTSAVAARRSEAANPETDPIDRRASEAAAAAYQKGLNAFARAFSDVRDPTGSTPVSADCDKAFPLPWPVD